MLRAILSVIAGYAAIVAFVFVTFLIAAVLMGHRAYAAPESWDVSTAWLVISFILGLIGAILGGWVCTLIARSSTPPLVLSALVLAFGLVTAALTIAIHNPDAPATRPTDAAPLEGFQHARTPPVALVLNPFIGAVGVLLGARLGRSKPGA